MNERIEEFVKESGLIYLSSVHPSMIEKFAELIIRECSEVADDCARNASWMAAYRIKQHFGVD